MLAKRTQFALAKVTLHSSLAVLIALVAPAVWAQSSASDADEADSEADVIVEEVVVFGMRQSLETAQDLKRDASTVVDSITAKELGSFPDKSVAEALQRVPGITVNRFAASADTAHFSAEPSGVLVRGLNQVRTEFNGRDSFSANSSRGLSWGDISPELMSGVDTYKNQMAELIEGGIAGTVNMRTRLPFDQADQLLAVTLSGNYGDLSEDITPEGSALYSNRWETSAGEFGFLANIAYSQVETMSEGNQLYRMNRFRDVFGIDQDGNVVEDINSDGTVDQRDTQVYIPAAIIMRDNLYDRERLGTSVALQWQNPDENIVVSTQYNRTQYDNAWEEYVVQVSPADFSYGESVYYEVGTDEGGRPRPIIGTDDFIFDHQGLFRAGEVNLGIGWWGASEEEAQRRAQNAAGQPFVNPCYEWRDCAPEARGVDTITSTRSNNNENMTQDLAINLKWNISNSIRSNFDAQYVESEVQNYDIDVGFGTFANTAIDLRGRLPSLRLSSPTNVNLSDGGWSNPNNYYLHHIMDHFEDSEGNQLSFRADFEFDLDAGPLHSVKVGARYADRDQLVRSSAYNWQSVATTYDDYQFHYFNLDRHTPTAVGNNYNNPNFTGYPQGFYEQRDFGSSYHDINVNRFLFADMNLIKDRQRMADSLGSAALGMTAGAAGWDPVCSNRGDRSGEIAGTCWTPAELVNVSEETNAIYAQLNFGGDNAEMFGLPYSGNLGVRWVQTENISAGGNQFSRLSQDYFFTLETVTEDDPSTPEDETTYIRVNDPTRQNLGCDVNTSENPDEEPPVPNTLGCYLSTADAEFMSGGSDTNQAKAKHEHFLPSFNLKLELTDELQARLAVSKAMSRPDMGNLRNFVSIEHTLPDMNNANDPLWVKNQEGEITGANVYYRSSAHNPYLKPITATQADITLEYYFAAAGSLTFAAFTKDFDDYIQQARYTRTFTNNGVSRTVEIEGPLNGDGAKLHGYEIAFQRFFDFLPDPFSGLGIQANYTHVNNSGISNTSVTTNETVSAQTAQASDAIKVDRLEGLSDHSYNLVGMYENDAWSARLAYSWRSEYLVTAIDCCVAYPVWQDDYGQLDGSIKYMINDNFDISFQASNILGEETVLTQQVTDYDQGELRLPNARFRNDRRYTLTLRFNY